MLETLLSSWQWKEDIWREGHWGCYHKVLDIFPFFKKKKDLPFLSP